MTNATPKTIPPVIEAKKPGFNRKLLAIATLERSILTMQAKRQQIYDLILAELDDDIKTAQVTATAARNALKAETLAHVATGGDPKALPAAVTFSKRTRLVYDKQEALAAALEKKADTVIRRKDPELDVRAFEKAFKAGELAWAQVEEVNDPTASISTKLGDLLIIAESGIAGEGAS